jgi:hypothetical protein
MNNNHNRNSNNITLITVQMSITCTALGPDTRITDMPARPGAEDSANIVLLCDL